MHQVAMRGERIASGDKLVPIAAAIMAVLAALATLFANHTSVTALAQKNEAVLYQSKAADQYNYYESQRLRVQIDRALLDTGVVGESGRATMTTRMDRLNSQAQTILKEAQSLESQSDQAFTKSQSHIVSYEAYEFAATLFQVSIVLVSISALMRPKVLLVVAVAAALVGLGFFAHGLLH